MTQNDFNTTTTDNALNLGSFDFTNLDKPNRGKQTLALIRINKKTLDSGAEKYTFCFLNKNSQSIYIDVFAEQMRNWFDRVRLVTGITAEGNDLIKELQNPHEFIVKDNEKGFPQFDFMQMLGLSK